MTDRKHTARWEVAPGPSVIDSDTGDCIAVMSSQVEPPSARWDNAVLIATAPGLLDENDRLRAENERLRKALKVAATAEVLDLSTGIMDYEALDAVQSTARAALSQGQE